MVTSLHVQNFQSHEDTRLEFAPGVNIIVGTSDSGKTALLRALAWLKDNPSGDAFRSHWGGDVRVELETVEGHRLARTRTKSDGLYWLDGERFAAVGRGDAPAEVAQALNLGPVNVQKQLDAPYLLSESPGEVARQLNAITHLDDIDRAALGINRIVNKARNELAWNQEQREDVGGKLEALAWIDAADQGLGVLEELERERREAGARYDSLARLRNQIDEAQAAVGRYADVDAAAQEVSGLLALGTRTGRARDAARALRQLVEDIGKARRELARYERLDAARTRLTEVLELERRYNEVHNRINRLGGLVDDATWARDEAVDRAEALQEAQAEFDRLMPDVCPLCGRGGE